MFLKKLLSYIVLPLPLALLLIAIGIVLLWFTARQRAGKVLVTTGAGLLLLSSWSVTSAWCLSPLQNFKPLQSAADGQGARWIVVLGSGYSDARDIPPNGRLDPTCLQRVIEGIRLYRLLPGTKLVVSGGPWLGMAPQAEVMADAAVSLGVPRADIVLESKSIDTQDEAVLIREIVGRDRLILVTSTMHMRRSMLLFSKQGMSPIPSPAGAWMGHRSLLPSSGQLSATDAAEHEYVGMLWSLLRGTI